ncbi:YceI family protein [Thiohalobacter sp. IOR34]|uniref:YceI family protein n=1 Tax=Thiohalobacter sp. IOR34 TaxID=3057176 RepID=UPI0025B1DB94|nr:YceI family protein [Thiohalobacter sp. IOR34]WJW75481.1 YceI family protein [Thiohalobacter sp. IOR34]
MIARKLRYLFCLLALVSLGAGAAEHYVIDTKGMHAFITFRVQHLGFSWLEGRFNRFSGSFDYDPEQPANNRVQVEIDVASLDSNHAERDKHLRSARFFDVKQYPKARFVSTAWEETGEGRAILKGRFTLRGVSRDIEIEVREMGAGPDPWGGYRRGFEGTTTLQLSDYRMKEAGILGPAANTIRIWLSLEGVRQ